MVAALFSSVLELLDIFVAEEAKQRVGLVGDVANEVEVLRNDLNAMFAALEDAEKKILTDTTIIYWTDIFTYTAYDLVDKLDELITTLRINRVEKTSNLKEKVGSYVTHSFHTGQVVVHSDLAFKLKEIQSMLNGITPSIGSLDLEVSRSWVESTPFVRPLALIGRDEIKGDIVSSLLYGSTEEESELLKTISVVGMGGVGKTAIAQLVYHDEQVKQHFDSRIWVCVSIEFDEKNVAKAIIAQVEHVAVDSLDSFPLITLLERIRTSIKGKKFFLVLDDVWADDMGYWQALIQTFKHGASGSRILLTTRKDTLANMMKDSHVFHLEMLSDEHCWMVFCQSLFLVRGFAGCEDLEDIGKRISKRCKGLPLAAKALGSLLSTESSKEKWEDILNSEILEFETAREEVFVPLLLSYYELPLPLRECFKYCAIFPKDFVYDGETIIYHWMAQGYLGWDNGEDLELKGREYISYSAARSFFQDFLMDEDGLKSTWKMHYIMHDFAQFLMIKDRTAITFNPKASSTIRLCNFNAEKYSVLDLSLVGAPYVTALIPEGCCLPTSIYGIEMLHSPVIIPGENAITNEVVRFIFDQAERLRLVDFGCHNALVDTIPKEIGNLIHLRHINLGGSKIKGLPGSLCELYNLQYLNLNNCESLENLPDETGRLINLRHINLGGSKIKGLPRSFCKLHNLRYLNLDSCEALENLPDEIGRLINLRHINLCGSKIKGLPRSLCELHNLRYLNLNSCQALENLPDEIGKLISLTYLGTLHCYRLACYPKSARRLTNLRQLHGIMLRADRNDPKEFTLGDLENLNHLRELSMVLKGNAVDDRELKRAKFENKTHLKEIKVE